MEADLELVYLSDTAVTVPWHRTGCAYWLHMRLSRIDGLQDEIALHLQGAAVLHPVELGIDDSMLECWAWPEVSTRFHAGVRLHLPESGAAGVSQARADRWSVRSSFLSVL